MAFKSDVFFNSYWLCENFSYLEFFWSTFSRTPTELGDLLCKSPYPVQMQENAVRKNSDYGRFVRSDFTMGVKRLYAVL